jgi:class 3 adenylate cyclase
MLWSALASARVLLGDTAGAHAALDEWEREDPRPVAMYRPIVRALSGGHPDSGVRDEVVPLPPRAPVNLTTASLAAANVELADALEQPQVAAGALGVLTEAYSRGLRFLPGWGGFVPRLAGVAHLLDGSYDDAEVWLHRAAADAVHAGAAGELAHTRYDLARVGLAASTSFETGELLETAIAGFGRLGYRPLATAARRLAGKPDLQETTGAATTRFIMVTDLVGSTPLARRVGDVRFVELLREHNRIVRTRLRQFDGVEFKHTGDGIAAWFLTGGAAVECALRISEDLERSNLGRPDDPLAIRIGISSGEVVREGTDMFGIAVNMAFRVCDHATDGRVLVSHDVPPFVRDASFEFVTFGDVVLKGFTDAQRLYAVTPTK